MSVEGRVEPFDEMTRAGLSPSWASGFACPDCGAKPRQACGDLAPDKHHGGRIRASLFGQVIPIRDMFPSGPQQQEAEK